MNPVTDRAYWLAMTTVDTEEICEWCGAECGCRCERENKDDFDWGDCDESCD